MEVASRSRCRSRGETETLKPSCGSLRTWYSDFQDLLRLCCHLDERDSGRGGGVLGVAFQHAETLSSAAALFIRLRTFANPGPAISNAKQARSQLPCLHLSRSCAPTKEKKRKKGEENAAFPSAWMNQTTPHQIKSAKSSSCQLIFAVEQVLSWLGGGNPGAFMEYLSSN
jgi:hypothetical protein